MSGQAWKQVFWAQPLIFYSLSTILICFQLFPTIFFHSINFNRFRSSLFISNCFYPNLRVTTLFYLFYIIFNYFCSFPTIFDRFPPLFNILTYILSPSIIVTHFQLHLLNFNHFQWFTITLTNLHCFLSYICKYELFFDSYYLYLSISTYFWFLQIIFLLNSKSFDEYFIDYYIIHFFQVGRTFLIEGQGWPWPDPGQTWLASKNSLDPVQPGPRTV